MKTKSYSNTKSYLKIGLLVAMLVSFFISNGITGTLRTGNGCSSDGNCTNKSCNKSDGSGGNYCCLGGGGAPCNCMDVNSQCSQ